MLIFCPVIYCVTDDRELAIKVEITELSIAVNLPGPWQILIVLLSAHLLFMLLTVKIECVDSDSVHINALSKNSVFKKLHFQKAPFSKSCVFKKLRFQKAAFSFWQ